MTVDREGASAGSEDDVAISHRPRAYLLAGLVISFFAVSAVLVPLILGPIFVETVLGKRPADSILLVFPLMMFALVGLALAVALRLRDMLRPTVFALGRNFEWKGDQYSWSCISKLFLNPGEKYIVVLFKELQSQTEQAGFTVQKKMIEPSLDALLKLADQHNVKVITDAPLTADDLWRLRTKLLKEQ